MEEKVSDIENKIEKHWIHHSKKMLNLKITDTKHPSNLGHYKSTKNNRNRGSRRIPVKGPETLLTNS